MRSVLFLAIVSLCACNTLTGANDLEPVDCLGDCHVAPGTFCGGALQCDKTCCVVDGGCAGGKCTCSGETSCAPTTTSFSCDGPEDCADGKPTNACAVKFELQGDCTISVASAQQCSTPDVTTTLAAPCARSIDVRVCHKSSDCHADEKCCPQPTNLGTLNVCSALGFGGSGSGCL